MKKTTKKTTTASDAGATSPAPKKKAAPAKKKAAVVVTESPATFISAKINIGFGNHLYLRGTGPGLSWDHGLAMDCASDDLWTLSFKNVKEPIAFKVLINDQTWCVGNDYVVEAGQSVTVTPSF